MASPALPLTSAEKKRVRDRRAQQNLRDKRNRFVESLRERVEDCEKNHGQQPELQHRFQELQDQCRALQSENNTLRQKLDQLRLLINSWAPSIEPADSNSSTPPTASPWLAGFSLSHASIPVWCLTPCSNDRPGVNPGTQHVGPWPMHGSLVNDSPDAVSPIDLLYGSKHNLLAAWIHRSLRRWTLRESERLAIGWLIYTFTNYMDIMLWQRLRANTMAKYTVHDMDNVICMLASCLKVRWPWGEDILELGDDAEVRMRQEFFEVITRVEGWGLAPKFIQAFPDLVEGLDVSSIVYKD
ncbi:hypothetical protein C8A05DRAFT_36020 [Staphylotrichum tortipilum]|uniref:BZIP domain-containing protein n=1 Tax=Staphylotrichum tortipilum TaxID=2831512 RepID=A0AAN6MHR7_9PEZI|nr:hypothetical protein C8A05DRAFT_36020 [Staphylotrichum longicolle]